jgi:hypothetical protein
MADEGNGETCQYCGAAVQAAKPGVTTCRVCWYSGESHARHPRIAPIIAQLQAQGFAPFVTHTGGGCFGLQVPLNKDGSSFAFCTVDDDAALPENAEDKWTVGHYTEEGWGTGDMLGVWDGLDDAELLARIETCKASR